MVLHSKVKDFNAINSKQHLTSDGFSYLLTQIDYALTQPIETKEQAQFMNQQYKAKLAEDLNSSVQQIQLDFPKKCIFNADYQNQFKEWIYQANKSVNGALEEINRV